MNVAAIRYASNVYETNRVLRNTFLLLGITLLPTLAGVWYGMHSGFNIWLRELDTPLETLLVLLGPALVMMALTMGFRDSLVGVGFLLLFTGWMGLTMSISIEHYLAMENGVRIVMTSVGITAGVCFLLGVYAMTTKRDFSAIGGFLFTALLGLLALMIVSIFVRIPLFDIAISAIAVLIFSGYLVYDVQRVVSGGERNYIVATVSIYLDIINLFLHILRLVGVGSSKD